MPTYTYTPTTKPTYYLYTVKEALVSGYSEVHLTLPIKSDRKRRNSYSWPHVKFVYSNGQIKRAYFWGGPGKGGTTGAYNFFAASLKNADGTSVDNNASLNNVPTAPERYYFEHIVADLQNTIAAEYGAAAD